MVSMQRSLSSPVNSYSSPPFPSTVTRGMSRSPTPPLLLEKYDEHVDLPQPRRFATRSPSRLVEGAMPSSPTYRTDTARRASAAPQPLPPPLTNLMVPNKTTAAAATTATITATATTTSASSATPSAIAAPPPITSDDRGAASSFPSLVSGVSVASQASSFGAPSSPSLPPSPLAEPDPSLSVASDIHLSSSSADGPVTPFPFTGKPLLQDVSFYSNAHVAPEAESTTLNELAHLVRLSKYQERKRASTRMRLQLNLVSTALSARLLRCGEMAHRSLTECFRSDDRANFASLYNAVHNVRKSCDELRRYALLETELDALRSPASNDSLDSAAGGPLGISYVVSFFNDIPIEARETLVTFLSTLRNNPDYLATRLCSLSTAELTALTVFFQGMEPIDSVLPFHNRQPSSRGSASGRAPSRSSALGNSGKDVNAVQKLLSFQRHDPLSALIHTCFANSAGPDSAEDRRRTDIWAVACARLISEKGAAGESVLIAVLNAWSTMRDWAGRSNMEWFLMKILEDGAFLLDRAEDQNGTRFNLNEWTSKDQIAAEEFYDRAIDDLFGVIDDEDATGIPEGFIELGNQILGKLDPKYVENTRNWLVYKWLFGSWLLSVVIHPETHGLMAEYHITEYGRQKILKEVALRAQRLVVERTLSLSHPKNLQPVSTPLAVKAHIDNILNRFRGSGKRHAAARLLPARSITSLRETVEVHPYLVVSPADLATLVKALFPDRRPQSAHSGSFRSGPGSISSFSVISQPIPVASQRSNPDTYSVLSTSISSANSDATTSVEPLLDSQQMGTSSSRYSPPPSSVSGPDRRPPNNYEDDGYRLHLAVHDMVHALGRDIVLGSCHPCAERWAVLFISADGNNLSTQMTYDPDDDDQEEDMNSTSAESDEESEDQHSDPERAELDSEYHQLRDSILKLVEDYEIPQEVDATNSKMQTFSNRATRLKKYRIKNKVITSASTASPKGLSELQSRNPYRRHMGSSNGEEGRHLTGRPETPQQGEKGKGFDHAASDQMDAADSVLITMLTAASSQSRAQSDFLSAHQFWKAVQQLNALTSESLRRDGFAALLNIFAKGPRDSIRRSATAVEEYDAWLVWLRQSQERAEGLIESKMRRLRALRDKMWYVTDVRNSAPYESSRNVAVALKTMGTTRKWNAYQRARQSMPRGPAVSYLYRTESEVVELLAAAESQCGPNKLSDDQADKTRRWLRDYGVENFCQGEERIHRFSCEIATCIDKLIGESIVDAPVLWSSDLYVRDRQYLEASSRTRRERNNSNAPWDDASSIASFDSESRRFTASSRSSSVMRANLTSTLGQSNPSLQSFDSSRHSFSKASTSLSDILDGQDHLYGGFSSPVPTINTSATYWSPFQATISPSSATSRAQSPAASTTNLTGSFTGLPQTSRTGSYSHRTGSGGLQTFPPLPIERPETSSSSIDTAFPQRASDEKSRFLTELRQTLTSLLLSDLGNLVFARGSETDSWFGGLGQECIERREDIEKRKCQELAAEMKRKSNRHSLKQRLAERVDRKSDNNELRTNGGAASDSSPSVDSQRNQSPGIPNSNHGNDSSATASDHTATARDALHTRRRTGDNNTTPRNRSGIADFPFAKAYQRLLRMFCVHPNPYAKLSALFELENLIAASLSSRSIRRRMARLTQSGTSPVISHASANATPGAESSGSMPAIRTKPLEETIYNIKGRRSNNTATSRSVASPISVHRSSVGGQAEHQASPSTGYSSNKDAIAGVLMSLFRDAEIRPKTLFRDLQFIASFVPAEVLDRTERGKAFWDAGLAALLLKQEVCCTMIEVADEIVSIHTNTRKTSSTTPSTPQDGAANAAAAPLASPSSTVYSFADAARMWTITAKEGDPTSQRELAIFYLSNPELVERTTLPLSKPREVFKKAVMEKYGGSSTSGRYHTHPSGGSSNRGTSSSAAGVGGHGMPNASASGAKTSVSDVRNDAALMCVAIHWMEAAEQGGDELARTFLGQNEMMK
ncbi:hypothetical protein SPI_08211 [Niveomyces insectorum RCEF 264]|uniref:Uncharacterized protein n=1 Tax=Niveomyces insectorum RCEF 264 TaxID=1081102 RepID=A0A167NG63_9HYPO|nr:hypothetical protein SPI_08211 [Niveomyces insectorum RCEF 264]